MNQIPALIRVFAYLSILTVGGGMAAFPEMKILTVDVHHWLDYHELIHLYSVGQLAPGPNMMMIVSIGDWAGGILGADRSAGRLLRTHRDSGTRHRTRLEQAGEVAVAHFHSAGTRARIHRLAARRHPEHGQRGSVTGWSTGGIALAVLLTMLWRKVNPAFLVLGGAVMGVLLFIPK